MEMRGKVLDREERRRREWVQEDGGKSSRVVVWVRKVKLAGEAKPPSIPKMWGKPRHTQPALFLRHEASEHGRSTSLSDPVSHCLLAMQRPQRHDAAPSLVVERACLQRGPLTLATSAANVEST